MNYTTLLSKLHRKIQYHHVNTHFDLPFLIGDQISQEIDNIDSIKMLAIIATNLPLFNYIEKKYRRNGVGYPEYSAELINQLTDDLNALFAPKKQRAA